MWLFSSIFSMTLLKLSDSYLDRDKWNDKDFNQTFIINLWLLLAFLEASTTPKSASMLSARSFKQSRKLTDLSSKRSRPNTQPKDTKVRWVGVIHHLKKMSVIWSRILPLVPEDAGWADPRRPSPVAEPLNEWANFKMKSNYWSLKSCGFGPGYRARELYDHVSGFIHHWFLVFLSAWLSYIVRMSAYLLASLISQRK